MPAESCICSNLLTTTLAALTVVLLSDTATARQFTLIVVFIVASFFVCDILNHFITSHAQHTLAMLRTSMFYGCEKPLVFKTVCFCVRMTSETFKPEMTCRDAIVTMCVNFPPEIRVSLVAIENSFTRCTDLWPDCLVAIVAAVAGVARLHH